MNPQPASILRLACSLVLAGALLGVPAAAQTANEAQSSRFDVSQYAIAAELFPSTHMLKARARIQFVPRVDVTSLAFELDSNLRVQSVTDGSQNLPFRQDGLTLTVNLPNLVQAGKTSSVVVDYGGSLATADGSPVENLKLNYVGPEGSYLLYTGRWFPVNGYSTNRFAAAIRMTVPSDEMVIASGKASAPEREAGKVTYTFTFDKPSFPGTVLAGKYVVEPAAAAGADITLYLKEGHQKFAQTYGAAAGKILAFFSDKFGPLPSGHLSIVEIADDTVGGYSAPGIVALASRGFSNPVNDRLLAHEISHQWWRCLVSPATTDDAFLDEGLASYASALYVEDSAGENAFADVMHEIEIGALTHEDVAPVSQASHLHEFTPEYQSIVFQKGAMVFHMLRWVIGDSAFFNTLRSMTQQYAWKSVSTQEFQRLAEAASKQQLTYFFAQWVDSTGVPQFKRTWAVYKIKSGYQVVGKITQDLDIFRMPVEVRVTTEGRKPVDERVEMVGTTSDFTINTVTKPLKVTVDPVSRILKYDDQTKIAVEMARGDQLVQQQAYLEAIKQYQQVLDLNKNSSLAHYRIGETFFKLHNYNAAAEEMRAALAGDLNPKWVEVWAHLTLGKIFDVTGQRDRALNEYQRALQTNDNTQGALNEANAYIQKPYSEANRQIGMADNGQPNPAK
ncbi:MAG TPA: M1 family aminopeptidase [Terriglobia bacterium]|nr:M1 family aminopeptidase [Terriglobia bacterium]